MKSRLIASVALGAAVLLGATGCSMVSPQATTIPYSPSDGVNVPDSGPIIVRNAMIFADDAGTAGNLVAALVNDTDQAESLVIGIDGDAQTVRVPARTTISLGVDADPLFIPGLGVKPGNNVSVSFQSGDATGARLAIPVLDGTLPYYTEFVPAP